eukprot:10519963-Lingulodinium_polyedra.AAC.1
MRPFEPLARVTAGFRRRSCGTGSPNCSSAGSAKTQVARPGGAAGAPPRTATSAAASRCSCARAPSGS